MARRNCFNAIDKVAGDNVFRDGLVQRGFGRSLQFNLH